MGGISLWRAAVALGFLALVGWYAGAQFAAIESYHTLIVAAIIGGYMALNIGANDVANNVGPAVGSFALTLGGAILVAAIFEAGGALLAGGNVVKTVKKGIIDPTSLDGTQIYIWVMMAALLGGAIWLNIATWLGAPVSTTHSIVGGVMGAGIAANGWMAVNWSSMGAIAASWVISPVTGGIIAAGLYLLLKRTVFFRVDILEAAKKMVPLMIALMAWAFGTYLAMKGLKHVVKLSFIQCVLVGLGTAVAAYFWIRPRIAAKIPSLKQTRDDVNSLFTVPLIFAAALLSFAHGANDVANAIGPLAGIFQALTVADLTSKAPIPMWIMLVGALGIALGLALYGPKLIRTVGSEITELDRTRAFCIALSAALTVIVASQLGLPVSSTHVALGAVFGVGFLREYLDNRMSQAIEQVLDAHAEGTATAELEAVLHDFSHASLEDKDDLLKQVKSMSKKGLLTKEESKLLRKRLRRKLVKRSAFIKIISAWLITVPVSAGLAAMFFFTLRGIYLP